jgi:hypothetical protein
LFMKPVNRPKNIKKTIINKSPLLITFMFFTIARIWLTPFHGKNVATYFDLWGVNLVDESYRNLFEQDKWNYHK